MLVLPAAKCRVEKLAILNQICKQGNSASYHCSSIVDCWQYYFRLPRGVRDISYDRVWKKGYYLCVDACHTPIIIFALYLTYVPDTGYQWAPFACLCGVESPSGSVLRWMG